MGKDHKDEFNCFLPRAYFYHDESGNLWRTTKCYIKSIPVYKLTSTILFVVYVLILIAQIYVWLEGYLVYQNYGRLSRKITLYRSFSKFFKYPFSDSKCQPDATKL